MSAISTAYAISKADAMELSGISLLPAELRLLALQKLRKEHGEKWLLKVFAEFIGLANSVIANNRESIEMFAIAEWNLHPHEAEEINLPDIQGALNGIVNAVDPVAGMCNGCAFRLGTPANQSPSTSLDAADVACGDSDVDFTCHMKPDEDGVFRTTCSGMVAFRQQLAEVRNAS